MNNTKILACLILLAIFSSSVPSAIAAVLRGKVYDYQLNLVQTAIISINSTPNQQIISKNGSFELYIPYGSYNLTGTTSYMSDNALISIEQDGVFTYDLILFPFFESELPDQDFSIDIPYEDLNTDKKNISIYNYLALIAIILIISGLIIAKTLPSDNKSRQKSINTGNKQSRQNSTRIHPNINNPEAISSAPVDAKNLTKEILNHLMEQGGRSTQKALRKILPFSEAKISLAITQLEHEKKIKKIKKGRGNIIILTD